MSKKEKLPINVTFEIYQHPAPNDHWYTVTPRIFWKEEYHKRMDSCMVLEKELEQIKEATCYLLGETFALQEVTTQQGFCYQSGDILYILGGVYKGHTFAVQEEGMALSSGVQPIPRYHDRGNWYYESELGLVIKGGYKAMRDHSYHPGDVLRILVGSREGQTFMVESEGMGWSKGSRPVPQYFSQGDWYYETHVTLVGGSVR